MQLDELIEKYGLKDIFEKTNIFEDAVVQLSQEDFTSFPRAKTLGLISILRREYPELDTVVLKEKIETYYGAIKPNKRAKSLHFLGKIEVEKKKSRWFLFFIFGLLSYASWYFFTQFDKRNLSELITFEESNKTKVITSDLKKERAKTLSLPSEVEKIEQTVVKEAVTIIEPIVTEVPVVANKIIVAPIVTMEEKVILVEAPVVESVTTSNVVDVPTVESVVEPVVVQEETDIKTIVLVPKKRLWFGIIDMQNGKKKHMSISKEYKIEVNTKGWLISTSAAPFSFLIGTENQVYDDQKSHHFLIEGKTITSLSKREYIAKGGYYRW